MKTTNIGALTLAATMAFGLAACGKKDNAPADAAKAAIQQSADATKSAIDSANVAADQAKDAAKSSILDAPSYTKAAVASAVVAGQEATDKAIDATTKEIEGAKKP